MSRQNLGAFIVSLAVVTGLIVVVFIVPAIQPPSVEARNALDEATDRAARRLNVVSRSADRAVAADRAQVTLPADIVKPGQEALQRAVAKNSELLQPTRSLAQKFQQTLGQQDDTYKRFTGSAPKVDAKTIAGLQPPTGETNQIAWVKQSYADRVDQAAKAIADLDTAISDLTKSMADAGSAGQSGSEHFRSNFVKAELQSEKAMLLSNLAANQRAQAAKLRSQLVDQCRWYADAAGQARAIDSRLKEITFSASAQPAGAQAAATPAADQAAGAVAAEPAADAQAPAEPAVAKALNSLPAAEEPATTIATYEKQIDQQIAATEQRIAELQQSMVQPQQQLEQAKAQAQQFQQELTRVDQTSYDVTNPSSFETYKKTYADVSAKLRQTEATIQSLQEGTMVGATVDPEGPDDLTKAKYLGGQPQIGLNTLARRLEGEQKVLADLQAAKKDLQTSQAVQQKYNQSLDGSFQQANARARDVLQQINKTCKDLDQLMSAAAADEDKALAACKQAEQAYNVALQAAKRDQTNAGSALSAASPSPDKPNRRLEMLKEYNNPEIGAERGLVNIYMLVSRINMQRANDLYVHLSVLNMARACEAQPADVEGTQKTLQQALDAATMALSTPDVNANALFHADRLSQLIQREKYVWLGPATRGLVYNMLAQVQAAAGKPQAAETRTKAAEALAEALKGNEGSELLQPYSLLLASLKQAN